MESLKNKMIFRALIGIFLATCFFIFRNTLVWGDSLNMFSPAPVLDAVVNTHVVQNVFDYIAEWYTGQNGRLSQAVLGAVIFQVSKLFFALPESFPSWLFKAGSLFFIIASGYTAIQMSLIEGQIKTKYAFIPMTALMSVWAYNKSTVNFPLWFDVCFIQYFLPFFLFLYVVSKVEGSKFNFIPLIVLTAFISNCTEHFLIICINYFTIQAFLEKKLRFHYSVLGISALIGAALFYFSPGQHARAQAVGFNIHSFLSPVFLLNWYKSSTLLGYQVLFEFIVYRIPSKIIYIGHFLLLLFTFLTAISPASWSSALIKKVSRIAFGFLLSYSMSLCTMLVSPYLPPWSVTIPIGILAIGLGFSAILFMQLVELKIIYNALNKGIAALFILFTVLSVYRETQPILSNYNEVIVFSDLRKRLFKKILQEVGEDQSPYAFYLDHFPVNSYGWSIEPPWGMSAYFRWVNKPHIQVLVSTDDKIKTSRHLTQVRRIKYEDLVEVKN